MLLTRLVVLRRTIINAVIVAGTTSGSLPGYTNAGGNDVFARKYDASRTVYYGPGSSEQLVLTMLMVLRRTIIMQLLLRVLLTDTLMDKPMLEVMMYL